ncbi:hypothetical protein N7532_004042 [Penicillium argentinense]|uniref:PRKR-interacting protein 1 n=1 Tax=Penicillium argentinense TaxID=1131581 RepID=A0A9W9KF96_9EURO|nr:uncharacterized protein N7532_004042 [Penicillium argentinense]KAJ5103513.1 hypothetical protein N7532_004042 [Penicillium argentinense]
MSEPGRESIPTSADPKSRRPTKRRALSPTSEQAKAIEALFKNPPKNPIFSTEVQRTGPSIAPPPEIVANVQGSSAGAGSGEFHVYKASRRREYDRLRAMQEEVDEEKQNAEHEKRRAEMKRQDEEKTAKNRRRRQKKMAARSGKKGGDGEKPTSGIAGPRAPGPSQDGAGDAKPIKNKGPGPSGDYAVDPEGQQVEPQGVIFASDD